MVTASSARAGRRAERLLRVTSIQPGRRSENCISARSAALCCAQRRGGLAALEGGALVGHAAARRHRASAAAGVENRVRRGGPAGGSGWRGEFVKEIPRRCDRAESRCVRRGDARRGSPDAHLPDRRSSGTASAATRGWAYRDAVWAQVIAGVTRSRERGCPSAVAVSYSDAIRPHTLGTLCELRLQETGERCAAMTAELRPPGGLTGPLDPEEPVQRQPEHRTGLLVSVMTGEAPETRSAALRKHHEADGDPDQRRRCS